MDDQSNKDGKAKDSKENAKECMKESDSKQEPEPNVSDSLLPTAESILKRKRDHVFKEPKERPPRSKKAARNNNSSDKDKSDPEYVPQKYLRMSNSELDSIATRIQIYHQTGVVVPETKENGLPLPLRNIPKDKKSNRKEHGPQVTDTHLRQGKVGTDTTTYGRPRGFYVHMFDNMDEATANRIRKAETRRYFEELRTFHLQPGYTNPRAPPARLGYDYLTQEMITDGINDQILRNQIRKYFFKGERVPISDEMLAHIKQSETRHYHDEVRDLHKHPEFKFPQRMPMSLNMGQSLPETALASSKRRSSRLIPIIPPLTLEKRRRIQEYINASRKSQSPNATEEESLLINSGQKLVGDSCEKTIVERIDFKKKNRRRSKSTPSHLLGPVSTSTPTSEESDTKNEANTSAEPCKAKRKLNLRRSKSLEDLSHLDRSFVTVRKEKLQPEEDKKKIDEDIMKYVNELVLEEQAAIEQAAEEKCQRLLQNHRDTRDILDNALGGVFAINHGEPIEILDDSGDSNELPNVDNNNPAHNSSVEVVEDEEIVLSSDSSDGEVEIVDLPSTSRGIRRRKKWPRTQKPNTRARKKQEEEEATLEAVWASMDGNEENGASNSLRECPICLEPMCNRDISSTICGHVFCTACIVKAVKTKRVCPNCRAPLTLKKIHPLFI